VRRPKGGREEGGPRGRRGGQKGGREEGEEKILTLATDCATAVAFYPRAVFNALVFHHHLWIHLNRHVTEKKIFQKMLPLLRTQNNPEWAVAIGILLVEPGRVVAKKILHAVTCYEPGKFNFRLHHALLALLLSLQLPELVAVDFPQYFDFLKRSPNQTNDKFPDIWLVAGGKKIPAHRHVLASFSHFFNALFGTTMVEYGKTEIPIRDIDPDILALVVQSCYCSQISVTTPEFLFKLFEAAQRFQMEELSEICLEAITQIPISQVADHFQFFLEVYDFQRVDGNQKFLEWITKNHFFFCKPNEPGLLPYLGYFEAFSLKSHF
jgi:hypothetical protein